MASVEYSDLNDPNKNKFSSIQNYLSGSNVPTPDSQLSVQNVSQPSTSAQVNSAPVISTPSGLLNTAPKSGGEEGAQSKAPSSKFTNLQDYVSANALDTNTQNLVNQQYGSKIDAGNKGFDDAHNAYNLGIAGDEERRKAWEAAGKAAYGSGLGAGTNWSAANPSPGASNITVPGYTVDAGLVNIGTLGDKGVQNDLYKNNGIVGPGMGALQGGLDANSSGAQNAISGTTAGIKGLEDKAKTYSASDTQDKIDADKAAWGTSEGNVGAAKTAAQAAFDASHSKGPKDGSPGGPVINPIAPPPSGIPKDILSGLAGKHEFTISGAAGDQTQQPQPAPAPSTDPSTGITTTPVTHPGFGDSYGYQGNQTDKVKFKNLQSYLGGY